MISRTNRRSIRNIDPRIQLPVLISAIEIENRTHVVNQDVVDIQPTRDEPTRLEQVIVSLVDRLPITLDCDVARIDREAVVLVDECELLNDVVVVAVVQDEKGTDTGWER